MEISNMITALVKFRVLAKAGHPMLDDQWITKSKVVEVEKATDLNELFNHIIDIKIL